ncbi:MAG: Dihydroorotate dehydrogenase B (NAD(+)), electron transfer subunit [Candidatus Omnitrophica bacterium ADurb.Bin205]|nr:MAG: Dihydroorotate dehydrogenase B (NAD(+)), electron transfer subunit [Candidatus Omnitrophica bacterium ADurb.Bin205]
MKILSKEVLSDFQGVRVISMEILAPRIALKAKPGQFIALMVNKDGERVPLTIVSAKKDTIRIIFQEAGFTTKFLGRFNPQDSLYAIVGPLGHATDVKHFGKVILVGGGVGIAEIYPVAKALKEAGNNVTAILGARTKGLLILENELRDASSQIFVATDDGSYQRKGFVTDILKELLEKDKYDLVYSVGPIPMMKRVAQVTRGFNVKTIVSLNALMVDATGMCGCCRVSVLGQTKFSCIDGPEFEAQGIDWDELSQRNRVYQDKEKHICNLNKLF